MRAAVKVPSGCLVSGGDRDGGAGFKIAPVGDLQTLNRYARSDDELLLGPAVLEFYGEDGAVHAGDGLADRAVGHGTIRSARPPRPVSVAIATHALGENAQLHCLLRTVRLRNAAACHIVARLDVGGRGLHARNDQRIVCERQGDRAAGRFDGERFTLDLIDGAGNALGLLRPRGGNRKYRCQGSDRHDPNCAHSDLPQG